MINYFNKYNVLGLKPEVELCLREDVVSLEQENKKLKDFVEWVASQHYANGLSKGMIIQKAKEKLEE